MKRSRLSAFAALLIVYGLAGCSLLGPAPDTSPTRYFVLNESEGLERIADLRNLKVGVGPIRFPEYLQRVSLARRSEGNRIVYSNRNRWAEPLVTNFQRVVADDLVQLLDTGRIALFPWYQSDAPDRRVSVDVQRFEVDPEGKLHLSARWTLRDGERKRLSAGKFDQAREAPANPDELVRLMSEMVGELAADLAVAISRSV